MSSLVFNNLRKILTNCPCPTSIPGQQSNNRGGPESSKLYGCYSSVVNSKVVPSTPSRTPIITVRSTPDSITTKRRNDLVLSVPNVVPEQRFSYVLPPIVPPPDIIAFIPYRISYEPKARIPVCVGPKRINT